MNVDLHLHSSASDGTLRPAELVAAAAAAGLDVIALTDHDTVAGVEEAQGAARALSIEVIPGVEVSTSYAGVDLHILAYFVDPTHPEILGHAEAAAVRREDRLRSMVERLKAQGVDVPFERVKEEAGGAASIGRPHLARALVAAGIVESVPRAFDLYIGNDRPAYIPSSLLETEDALGLIRRAGGVSVWAHPPIQLVSDLVPILKEQGLQGLEVYRPRASPERVLRLEGTARSWGLLVSGGSDWHGPAEGAALGDFHVPSADVAGLLEAGGL